MLVINKCYENIKIKKICEEFVNSNKPKYIFGTKKYAKSIANFIEVDGFIDDFTSDKYCLEKPIVPIEKVPNNAIVVMSLLTKSLIVEKIVKQFQFSSVDYFSFYKYSKLPIEKILFLDGFIEDFEKNKKNYEWIYELLNDSISKNQFFNLINFRISYDIDYMRGFSNIEHEQYFEEFLNLSKEGECFIDIGGFDGYTTKEFVKRCPKYESIHFFEPEIKNMSVAKNKLSEIKNITYYSLGLSNKKQILNFSDSGSSSKICKNGEMSIDVDLLDNILDKKVTFIKMDIEGAESEAIDGAKKIIEKYRPKLAICVYHKHDDFWKIPQKILSINNNYKIYLRHYTQGISETVMFFI